MPPVSSRIYISGIVRLDVAYAPHEVSELRVKVGEDAVLCVFRRGLPFDVRLHADGFQGFVNPTARRVLQGRPTVQ